MIDTFPKKLLALAVTSALSAAALPAFAQNATDDKKSLDLERVVITATATQGSKMKQSLSVSTLDDEQIRATQATSAAELLRSIPGIRSESSGGEGNANITVRGVPISAGGARYVQLQENGLPIMLFGDVAFATSDMFLRLDNSLDQVQAVRGGSASTLATNSPGGVVNFITKTGIDQGGSVGLSQGLGLKQTRLDFDYGSGLSKSGASWHVGGFYRQGEGAHPSGVTQENGGQLQGSFSQNFAGGSLRIYAKLLDDKTPTLLPVPVRVVGGNIVEIPGVDPRTYTPYGGSWPADSVLNKDNTRSATNVNDGLTVRNTAVGGELKYDLGNGFKLENKVRFSAVSGRFTGVFPWDTPKQGTYTIASGPNKGQSWTGLATNVAVFNTAIDDMGSITDDLKVTKSIALSASDRLDFTGGLFYSRQNVSLTWNFNHYQMQVVNANPALLASAGAPGGLISLGAKDWGYCCNRAIDTTYTTVSPYAAVAYESGPVNLDLSLRQDRQSADGSINLATNNATTFKASNAYRVDYSKSHASFSLGGNFRASRDMAFFARYSDGAAFNADRIYGDYNANISGGGIPINTVKQAEAGIKIRAGNFSGFATLFNARTTESNYEATTRKSTQNSYRANGAELEGALLAGDFRIAGGLTITDAKITDSNDKASIGKTPRRQANVVYQLTPSYTAGPFSVGAALIGTGKSFGDDGNTITMKGYTVVNAFVNYQAMKNLTVGLGVNNLANTIGYTEIEGDGHAARSINGRTVKATLRYSF
jgi:outer membrane receptor protein involved in Fe transport